jgi:hypothetical protein
MPESGVVRLAGCSAKIFPDDRRGNLSGRKFFPVSYCIDMTNKTKKA